MFLAKDVPLVIDDFAPGALILRKCAVSETRKLKGGDFQGIAVIPVQNSSCSPQLNGTGGHQPSPEGIAWGGARAYIDFVGS